MLVLRGLNEEHGNGALDTIMYGSYTDKGGSEGVNVLVTCSGIMEMKGLMFGCVL